MKNIKRSFIGGCIRSLRKEDGANLFKIIRKPLDYKGMTEKEKQEMFELLRPKGEIYPEYLSKHLLQTHPLL